MSRRNGLLRAGILAASAISASLFILFGIDAIASLPVHSALKQIDSSVSIGDFSITSGVLLLEDIRFPEKDFFVRRAVIYWSGSPFNPRVDSILVHGGNWRIGRSSGTDVNPSSRRDIPPGRFDNFEVVSSSDTAVISGSFSGGLSGDSLQLMVETSWGMGRGKVFIGSQKDSIHVNWFRCDRLPAGLINVPEMLRDLVFEGCVSASRSDHLSAEGLITEVDGESAEVYFELNDSSGSLEICLSTDLSNVRDVLVAQSAALLGDIYIDFDPAGYFTMEFTDFDTIGVSVNAMLDSIRMFSPGLADDTVNTAAALRFEGMVCVSSWDVRIDSGTVVFGNQQVNFELNGSFDEYPRLSLRLWSESLSGEDITSSVPSELLGSLEGLELGGEASFDVLVVLDWETPDSSDFQAIVDVSDLSVQASPISIGQLRNRGSCLMRDSWGNRRRIYLDTLENQEFVLFDSLHPSFEGLLRCAEDATFRSHSGFCLYHIRNSIRANMKSGKFTRGGSTITMQLARNLFLGREKTFARKMQEVFLTWRLEVYLSKNRMIEIYANIVELGPDVFGFQEAARYYFSRDFRELSTRQVAYLVSILPGPSLYYRYFRNNSVPLCWENYLDRLINISENRGWIDPDSATRALADSIMFRGI
ncbi:MAG: transglycosylase domain-containing protein [Candidatus Aegiribacteria sp.]|nr:transglycosylase domain-containing protein [Candidatus Aegiribacteria sp.]